MTKEARVVNIIGRAPSAAIKPPFGELWVINNGWNYGHKPDKWFCMDGLNHVIQAASGEGIPEEKMVDFIKSNPTMEIYSPRPEDVNLDGVVIASSTPFEIGATSQLIPGHYYNSSIAHLLAYVAAQESLGNKKVDFVNLIGIELWSSVEVTEYDYQRPCTDFWLAYLYGMGIQITVPAYALLAKDTKWNIYGYGNIINPKGGDSK